MARQLLVLRRLLVLLLLHICMTCPSRSSLKSERTLTSVRNWMYTVLGLQLCERTNAYARQADQSICFLDDANTFAKRIGLPIVLQRTRVT